LNDDQTEEEENKGKITNAEEVIELKSFPSTQRMMPFLKDDLFFGTLI
jgi:hypothetical protein